MTGAARALLADPRLAQYAAALAPHVHDQVHLTARPAALGDLAPGVSRFGGPPDLPDAIAWPTAPSGRPLPFLLQLALDEVGEAPAAARLPSGGLLSFFALQAESPPGAEGGAVAGAVLYTPPGVALVRRAMLADAREPDGWEPVMVCAVELAAFVAVDPDEVLDVAGEAPCAALDEDARALIAAHRQPGETDGTPHLLFPSRQLGALGVWPPDGRVGLLELRSEWDISMNWGDAAWLTFDLPVEDLAAARFDRAGAAVWIG